MIADIVDGLSKALALLVLPSLAWAFSLERRLVQQETRGERLATIDGRLAKIEELLGQLRTDVRGADAHVTDIGRRLTRVEDHAGRQNTSP